MATARAPTGRSIARFRLASVPHARSAPDLWLSIAAVLLFLGITIWWLTQDRSIPIFDAGTRLSQAIIVFQHLRSGSVGTALTITAPYPPLTYLVGALGLWIGGLGVAPPIIAQNIVFVPLLGIACYQTGRLAYGPRGGLLAVLFALGSPLTIAQFHVFMIDAPETTMVAVAVWLILASKRFSHLWISAAAGVGVGLGMLTKEPFAFFILGVVVVALARGGWRAWRGFAIFAIVALAIAMPWYLSEFSQVHELARGVTSNQTSTLSATIAPQRGSITNLTWYFSNVLNQQLYFSLFVFAMIGGLWTVLGLVRKRPLSPLSWELLAGAFVGWLGITVTFPHDPRYSMPLLIYLAVLGSGWIVLLSPRPRIAATSVLVLIVISNMLSTSFGIGKVVSIHSPKVVSDNLKMFSQVTIYSNAGFLVSGPRGDGNVLGLMQALRHHGVREVTWINLGPGEPQASLTPQFSTAGLRALARIAQLETPVEEGVGSNLTRQVAVLGHRPIAAGEPPPCVKLSDGTGVWVRLGNPNAKHANDYCPFRNPAFYH